MLLVAWILLCFPAQYMLYYVISLNSRYALGFTLVGIKHWLIIVGNSLHIMRYHCKCQDIWHTLSDMQTTVTEISSLKQYNVYVYGMLGSNAYININWNTIVFNLNSHRSWLLRYCRYSSAGIWQWTAFWVMQVIIVIITVERVWSEKKLHSVTSMGRNTLLISRNTATLLDNKLTQTNKISW